MLLYIKIILLKNISRDCIGKRSLNVSTASGYGGGGEENLIATRLDLMFFNETKNYIYRRNKPWKKNDFAQGNATLFYFLFTGHRMYYILCLL